MWEQCCKFYLKLKESQAKLPEFQVKAAWEEQRQKKEATTDFPYELLYDLCFQEFQ